MKNNLLHSTSLGLFCAAALVAAPLAVSAQSTQPTTPQAPAPDTRVGTNVSGKVDAKTDSTMTVAGRTISLNSATTYSRNGASIGSGDVKVGYKVNVVTSENGQVAVAVDVIATD